MWKKKKDLTFTNPQYNAIATTLLCAIIMYHVVFLGYLANKSLGTFVVSHGHDI